MIDGGVNEPLSHRILETVFLGRVPIAFTEMIDFGLADKLLSEFKMVIVLPLGKPQPVRVVWSDAGEPNRWQEKVTSFLSAGSAGFLENGPARCRRVLDSDGSTGELFLDDLHYLPGSDPSTMCSIYNPGQDGCLSVRRVDSPVAFELPRELLFHRAFLQSLAIGGMWAVRMDSAERLMSVLWVTEAKNKGNFKDVNAVVERNEPPPQWGELNGMLSETPYEPFVDALEFFLDGRIDLSVAFHQIG
jgi:hypothetical protein|tara:strand:+ start:154 stop:891 length:738 start_codon:yes stop_codon:yes gene_type:complete